MARFTRKFIDIGANLTDLMYQGIYNGEMAHPPDIENVVKRAFDNNVDKIIITSGYLEDAENSVKLSRTNNRLFTTIGCHPTRAQQLEENSAGYIEKMIKLFKDNPDKIVAVGEFGLDYDRLHFCPKDIQIKNFKAQFELVDKLKLPLFLHCRAAAEDFISILQANRHRFSTGVVHSFTGTFEEAKAFLDLDLFIGLNGCSLKTEQNLEVVKKLPLEKIMIETDAPWCEIKQSSASSKDVQTKFESVKKKVWSQDKMVKGRNEPANIIQVLEVICKVKNIDIDLAAETIYNNTQNMFWPNSRSEA